MNPTAFVFWAFLALIGWFLGDLNGALIGLAAGLGVSLFATLFLK